MIIEILGSDVSVVGAADFTVNNAVAEVAVNPAPVGGLPFSGAVAAWFEPGDNALLTGLWVNIPYGFAQGTGRAFLTLNWEDAGGVMYPIPALDGGAIAPPNVCELGFPPDGLFLMAPRNVGRVRLALTALDLNVSMLNVPALINGVTLPVQWHLRVNHTLPLAPAP